MRRADALAPRALLEDIAAAHLAVPTLDVVATECFDVAVWRLHLALAEAYAAGRSIAMADAEARIADLLDGAKGLHS
ncbi:MAG: hypothetical protein AAGE03_04560 [Pseudomonadota bacterium]